MDSGFPMARHENIVMQDFHDEILICDLNNFQAYCLNQTAKEVWKLCDGKTGVPHIAKLLSEKFRSNVSEELVLLSLDELSRKNLLTAKIPAETLYAGISRRDMLKRLAASSMIALPLVSVLLLPTSAQAQTLRQNGQACSIGSQCVSGFCVDSFCCNNACIGVCRRCSQPGLFGICTNVPAGQDPDNECPAGPGQTGVCNGAGACI